MRGLDAKTGKAISGLAHLKQSVRDILTTPLGSRVMRRDYGSRLYELIDKPLNRLTIAALYAATFEAILTWEKRIMPRKVSATTSELGKIVITLEAVYVVNGEPLILDGIVIA